MGATRTGVLVLRVWAETEAPELRARLIESAGLDGAETSITAAGVDGICSAVRAWLEQIAVRDASVTPG
jgi:hypothetical protein